MIEIMEVSKEEMELILRDRAERARKAEIEECAKELKRLIARIRELKGKIYLPSIGGKYVSYHSPMVTENNISIYT